MKNHLTRVAGATLLAFVLILAVGCRKEEETIATITVRNDLGSTVPGATVRLFGKPSADGDVIGEIRIDTTAVTNATGKVSFNLSSYYKQGQAGFMVLDIEAEKGSLNGIGIIKVEEETTSEEVVEISD